MLSLKQTRRLAVSVVGATVIMLGLVLLVIPGPGVLTIAFGLAILAGYGKTSFVGKFLL
jgi:hypothetical protein